MGLKHPETGAAFRVYLDQMQSNLEAANLVAK